MKKKDIIFILVVGIIIGSVFAGYGAYAATSYALKSEVLNILIILILE